MCRAAQKVPGIVGPHGAGVSWPYDYPFAICDESGLGFSQLHTVFILFIFRIYPVFILFMPN